MITLSIGSPVVSDISRAIDNARAISSGSFRRQRVAFVAMTCAGMSEPVKARTMAGVISGIHYNSGFFLHRLAPPLSLLDPRHELSDAIGVQPMPVHRVGDPDTALVIDINLIGVAPFGHELLDGYVVVQVFANFQNCRVGHRLFSRVLLFCVERHSRERMIKEFDFFFSRAIARLDDSFVAFFVDLQVRPCAATIPAHVRKTLDADHFANRKSAVNDRFKLIVAVSVAGRCVVHSNGFRNDMFTIGGVVNLGHLSSPVPTGLSGLDEMNMIANDNIVNSDNTNLQKFFTGGLAA